MASSNDRGLALETASLGGLHWFGIALALISGAAHLVLGARMVPSAMGISFLLAGLGFVGAVVLIFLNYRRRAVYAVGIPFVLVQILLWYLLNFAWGPKVFPADVGTLGAIDKVAQLLLLGVLIVLLRQPAGSNATL
jgi:hypothetical protein